MEQLLAHLVGDYVLQNHLMANKKTSSWFWATIHVLLYGLPFLLLVSNWQQWAVIVGTHLIIDRFRLARYWVEFWGVGVWPSTVVRLWDRVTLTPAPRKTEEVPPFLSMWLLILVDNTFHLCINYGALTLL